MEHTETFSAVYGNYNSISARLEVRDGKIVWAEKEIYHYLHGTRSRSAAGPEHENFDKCVKIVLKSLYEEVSKTKYERLVESLDQETLDKYFKKSYIPK